MSWLILCIALGVVFMVGAVVGAVVMYLALRGAVNDLGLF